MACLVRSISDRGPQFSGAFNRSLAAALRIQWNMSTAFHPQTDGQTQRSNRTIEDMLCNFIGADMSDWDCHLALIQFAINNAWQESVQNTAFFLNHGRHPRTLLAANIAMGGTQLFSTRILPLLSTGGSCSCYTLHAICTTAAEALL